MLQSWVFILRSFFMNCTEDIDDYLKIIFSELPNGHSGGVSPTEPDVFSIYVGQSPNK